MAHSLKEVVVEIPANIVTEKNLCVGVNRDSCSFTSKATTLKVPLCLVSKGNDGLFQHSCLKYKCILEFIYFFGLPVATVEYRQLVLTVPNHVSFSALPSLIFLVMFTLTIYRRLNSSYFALNSDKACRTILGYKARRQHCVYKLSKRGKQGQSVAFFVEENCKLCHNYHRTNEMLGHQAVLGH